jgi:hypothetical protein
MGHFPGNKLTGYDRSVPTTGRKHLFLAAPPSTRNSAQAPICSGQPSDLCLERAVYPEGALEYPGLTLR